MKHRVLVLLFVLFVGVTQQAFFWGKKSKPVEPVPEPQQKVMVGKSESAPTQVVEPQSLKIAPDFTLKNARGNDVSLSQFKGSIVVLEWTNHDCPYVKKHYSVQNMQDLQSEYARKRVVWLSIISSAPGKQGHVSGEEAIQIARSNMAIPEHILLDETGEVGRLYKAKTTPHMFIIDKNGALAYQGAIDNNKSSNPDVIPKSKNYVRQALDELLAGKPVSKSRTKPYGCSIKY